MDGDEDMREGVSQSHDYGNGNGTLGVVEDSQGILRVAPSTILQGRLLNGISASRNDDLGSCSRSSSMR